MKCPSCQSNNRQGIKFCEECGTKLEIVCPVCKAKIPLGKKFCGECGSKLFFTEDHPQEEVSYDKKFEKIKTNLPNKLIEKILSEKANIEGERKQVAVVFCDIEGFTPLVEKLGAEKAFSMMDQVYDFLIKKVHDYEGTVNELTGDGIMALFGAPLALEDAPQRAIRAAASIHRAVSKYNERMPQNLQTAAPIKMRIGIHTGPVVIGSLGNDLRIEFKAVGDTVNIASRIEALAESGSTYVSEDTFRLTEGYFRFEAIGQRNIKGKTEPVKVFRVISPSSRKTRFDVSAERGLTPLVGRERDLELILDGFRRTKSGKGQALSIVADAGLGKSRLLYEFRKKIANEDVTFLEGRCLSYSRNVAYLPLIDMLKSNFDIQEGDSEDERSKKIQDGLRSIGADENFCTPIFLELLSVKEKEFDSKRVSPEIKGRINEAFKQISIKGSEIRPLVLTFEDLHWIDKSSEDLLINFLDMIFGARILVIFTYRPEFVHTWGGKSYHNQLNLNRLSNRESLKMVYHLLEATQIDGMFEDFILEKTEGVPFFIEEFITSLKNLQLIEFKNDTFYLSKGDTHETVPGTIHDVIMARVDGMPEMAKEVLRTGSAIEREFSFEIIKRVMDISDHELIHHLSVLKDAELIYERGIYPNSTGVFKHAMTQQVVYDSIMTDKKKRIHEAVGNAIEEIYAGNIEDYYAILSEQFCHHENKDKCVKYTIKTGDRAMGLFAWLEARISYESALQIIGNQNLSLKANLLGKLAVVTMFDLDIEVSLNYALAALSLFEELKDKKNQLSMLMHIQSIYTGGYLDGSKEDKALKYLEKAAEISRNEPDSIEKGLIYQRTAHLYLHRGQPNLSMEWASKADNLFTDIGVDMGTSIGTAQTYLGDIENGIAYNENNWPSVLNGGNPMIIAIIGHELSLTHALCKNVPSARMWGEKILPEVSKAGDRFEGHLLRPLGLIYALSGQFLKARRVCEKELAIEKKTLMSCFLEDGAAVGFHFLQQGEWQKAKDYLSWAIKIHKERNNIAALGACYHVYGNLHLAQKKYSESEYYLMKCLEISRNGGNVIFELWALPVLCELYLRTGDINKAINYNKRGFALISKDGQWFGLPGAMYLTRGMINSKLNEWQISEESFNKAIEICQKYQLVYDEGKANLEFGNMFLAKGTTNNKEQAINCLSAAKDIFKKTGANKDFELVQHSLKKI